MWLRGASWTSHGNLFSMSSAWTSVVIPFILHCAVLMIDLSNELVARWENTLDTYATFHVVYVACNSHSILTATALMYRWSMIACLFIAKGWSMNMVRAVHAKWGCYYCCLSLVSYFFIFLVIFALFLSSYFIFLTTGWISEVGVCENLTSQIKQPIKINK